MLKLNWEQKLKWLLENKFMIAIDAILKLTYDAHSSNYIFIFWLYKL